VERLKGPLWQGRLASWDDVDARIDERLQTAVVDHDHIVLLTSAITGPATRDLIGRWSRRYDRFRHVVFDAEMATLVADMRCGDVRALMIYGVNPVHDYAHATSFLEGMKHVELVVSFADRLDQTALLAHAVCPDDHCLDAGADAELTASACGPSQLTISPQFETRSVQDSLLKWLGEPPDFHAYLRDYWAARQFDHAMG
jgi:hypothetical protein